MQYGAKQPVFGLHRLKIVEWIWSLLLLKDESICKKIAELEFPKLLLELIKENDMNSFLHIKVYNVFSDAISIRTPLYIETVCFYFY